MGICNFKNFPPKFKNTFNVKQFTPYVYVFFYFLHCKRASLCFLLTQYNVYNIYIHNMNKKNKENSQRQRQPRPRSIVATGARLWFIDFFT